MWVQLKSVQILEEAGVNRTYHPGDFVNVGKQTALLWVQNGQAILPGSDYLARLGIAQGSGVLIVSDQPVSLDAPYPDRERFVPLKEIQVQVGPLELPLPFERNVIWTPGTPLRLELIPVGLSLLSTWQIACPILSYDTLACHVGNEEERARTQTIVHDLRVPMYEVGLIFARRCVDTDRLIDVYMKELKPNDNRWLAFLRALYQTPLFILALPATWHQVNV